MRGVSKVNSYFRTIANLTVAGTVFLTGCSNVIGPRYDRAPEDSYMIRSSASSSGLEFGSNDPYSDENYNCPTSPNVVPDYDYLFDGSGQYRVCKKKDSDSDILIHGRTSLSNSICIFPAHFVDVTTVYTRPDPMAPALPWFKCFQIAEAGIFASFPNTSFNAVFIVERGAEYQMRDCLKNGGNYYTCPSYSFGKFR